MRGAAALLLALLASAAGGKHYGPGDDEIFKSYAAPILREYIFTRYDQYAASELTFKDIKKHLAKKLDMTYEELKMDIFSSIIEDAVDDVTNACNGGKVPINECKRKVGYLEKREKYVRDKDET